MYVDFALTADKWKAAKAVAAAKAAADAKAAAAKAASAARATGAAAGGAAAPAADAAAGGAAAPANVDANAGAGGGAESSPRRRGLMAFARAETPAPRADVADVRKAELEEEFDKVFGLWVAAIQQYDWAKWNGRGGFVLNPGEDAKVNDPLAILFHAPVGAVLRELQAEGKFGWLPRMAAHSIASIGPVLSQSFCERVNSCANIVLTTGNTKLSPEEISALVTLRMNKKLLDKLKHKYKDIPSSQKMAEIKSF